MDVEVTQILKKWNLSNPVPKKHVEIRDTTNQQETFDTRTFTRSKRRTFTPINQKPSETSTVADSEKFSMESGVSIILCMFFLFSFRKFVFFKDCFNKFTSWWPYVFNIAEFDATKLAE